MAASNNYSKAEMLIRKPVKAVFEAFINPDITTKFWFSKSSGKLVAGKKIYWTWELNNLIIPVQVEQIDSNERIIIEWGEGKQKSTVEWEFKPLGKSKTFVTITNYDFQGVGTALISQIRDSTGGFNLLIAGLKAWLEHGIELNLVEDKLPKELRKK